MKLQLAPSRPVKLEVEDDRFLRKISHETGLSISDIQRRSIKLLRRQAKMFKGYGFILDLAE